MPKTTKSTQPAQEASKQDVPKQHPDISENASVDIVISWEKIKEEYQKILKKYQPLIKTDGFRKGKAPLAVVEEIVGKNKIFEGIAERLLPPAYVEAIKEANLKPISDPEVHPESINEGEDWKFHAHVAEKPIVVLGKFKDTVKKAIKKFEEEEKKVEKELAKKKKEDDKDEKKDTQPTTKPEDRKIDTILRSLQENIAPKIPELLIRQEVNRSLQELERQLQTYNMKIEAYLQTVNRTIEDIQQEFAARALTSWQLEMILDAIAGAEKIDVNDEEVDKIFPDTLKTKPTDEDKARATVILRKQKVLEFLKSL